MPTPTDSGAGAPVAATPSRPGLSLDRFAAAAAERRAALPSPQKGPGSVLNRARSPVLSGAQQRLNFFGPAEPATAEAAGS